MTHINRSIWNVVPGYGPYLIWLDLWTDDVAGKQRREWFWDRFVYAMMEE